MLLRTPLILFIVSIALQLCSAATEISVPLAVGAGAPLRLYITKRLPMRRGQPVEAKLIEPVYAFDRIVIPAGVTVRGHVTRLDPVSKFQRTQSIIGGDFTPLHFARVEFTEIVMPDGRVLPIHARDSEGLTTIYSPASAKKKRQKAAPANPGAIARAKDQIRQQIDAQTQGVIGVVRGPNKKEWVEDFLLQKLPYRPQWYKRNTRFDAVLAQPLEFGAASMPAESFRAVGMPAGDSVAQVRLLTPVNSGTAKLNEPITAVLSQPIFSPDHRLLLPEGSVFAGHVKHVQRARWFHRGGQLRFTFDRVDPPALLSLPAISAERSQLQLAAAETDPQAHVKVDSEGNAKATEPKTRFIGPAVALLIANKSADNDVGRNGTASATGNYGGRSLGGLSGFGYLGTAAAESSKTAGAALGFYGLGVSVFANIVSRGSEVDFPQNSAIEVRFGAAPSPGNHLVEVAGN